MGKHHPFSDNFPPYPH